MPDVNPTMALQHKVREYKTQKDAAKALGISPAYLSDLVNGRRDVPTKILAKLGLRKAVVPK